MHPKALLEALAAAEVDYVLIGGLAAALHGTTRVTRDIDIVYATRVENLSRLCRALNVFEPRAIVLAQPHGAVFTLTSNMLRDSPIMKLATTVGEIDILNKIDGFASYGYVKKLSELQVLGTIAVPVLSIDGLLKAKRAMKRPKDLQDIIELEAIREVKMVAKIDDSGDSFRVR